MAQRIDIVALPRPSTLFARLRARLRQSDVEVETVEAILAEYGLDLIKPIRNLPVGRRNTNVEVETNAGRKLLKGYRPQWKSETVRYAHSIMQALSETSFPAPRLTTATNGITFVEWTGTHYALFDYEEGTNYSGRFLLRSHRRQLMEIAGETLARFHQELCGFMPEGRHHMGFADYVGERWRNIDWHIDKVQELKQKSRYLSSDQESATAGWLIETSGYVLDELTRLDSILTAADLPRLIIHGDYGLHNLLIRDDGTAIPVDFELTRLEWRLSDLVSCLSRFRYSRATKLTYDFESIQWFMNAYQAEFPLSKDEWMYFPQVWAFYRLQSAIQYWNSYFETGGPTRKLFSARDAIDQVVWALNHPALLLELNAGINT